jgi:hypothetical protein
MQARTDERTKANVFAKTADDPIQAGRDAIAKIAATELDTWDRVHRMRVEVDSAGALSLEAAADALIRGENIAGALDSPKARKIRDEVETLLSLLGPLRQRRIAAIKVHFANQVLQMREQAAAKRAEVAEIDERLAPLLSLMSDIEDIKFDRSITLSQQADGRFENAGRELLAPSTRYAMSGGFPCAEPLSCRLRAEADQIEREAARVQTRSVPDSGAVNADSLDALIKAVYRDPTTIGPAIENLTDWFRACDGRMRRHEQNNRHLSQGAVTKFMAFIVWRAGTIVESESYISAHFHQFSRHDSVAVNL